MKTTDKIRILLVEDEQTLSMIIKDTLEEKEFLITTAKDGEEGLRLFMDFAFKYRTLCRTKYFL